MARIEKLEPSTQSRVVFNSSNEIERVANDRLLHVKTYNIQDIVKNDPDCPVRMDTLKHLIRSQASLHMAQVNEDSSNRLNSVLRDRNNTIRGFVLYAEGAGPVAYAIYYPMIDGQGSRVAYCEDFFIVESFRGYGVANILFHELAKRTRDDNAEYLQWATDKRNTPVQTFVEKKLGADTPPQVVTISANNLLNKENKSRERLAIAFETAATAEGADPKYAVRPITRKDLGLIEDSGFSPNIIRNTGDLPFLGYIITKRANPLEAKAIVPGWIHFSTFQVKEGIHLENPFFVGIESEEEKTRIISAVIDTACKNKLGSNHLRWHVNTDNYFMIDLLQNKLDLAKDSMLGTPESELVVYTLSNGNLQKLAETTPNRTLVISATVPIGTKREEGHKHTHSPKIEV
jgi:GNAT superfamily N-acetyltransferase